MKNRDSNLLRTVVLAIFMLASGASIADLTSVRVLPSTAQANEGSDFSVTLAWTVNADAANTDVASTARVVINPTNGRQLDSTLLTLADTGTGPYSFTEVIRYNATDIDSWIAQGLSFVLIQREFSTRLGSTALGSLRLNLVQAPAPTTPTSPSSPSSPVTPTPSAPTRSTDLNDQRDGGLGYLVVQSLSLQFENGNDLAVTAQREELRANLLVRSQGQGLLEGRWQVAEPGNSGEVPIFRTLSLVRKNVQQGQRLSLVSPRLPTNQVGKFLVRFCAQVNRTELRDEVCTDSNLTALAAYEVQGEQGSGVRALQVQSPVGGQVNENTVFAWQDLSGAVVYQLQIFSLHSPDLPSSEQALQHLEPTFITGMVLPHHAPNTQLSELVKSKLVKGRSYIWRVTAQNASGQLVGMSQEQTFVYR